MTLVPRKT